MYQLDCYKEFPVCICLDCNAWLSLGEANDDDPGVQVEIRAAEIAGEVAVRPDVIRGKYNTVHSDVGRGWWVHQMSLVNADEVTHLADAQAGYLARCITTHDTQHEAGE